MIKKEYMTPELEEFELELQCPILDLSTSDEEPDPNEFIDL
jgi:hypothetical protein